VFRFLDLEFVFQIIFSLFAILFAFDAVNGEKERGTLRLSFANSVPRANYILGKIFGSFLALVVPLLIPVLIGMVMMPLMGVPMSSNEWVRLVLFIFSSLLYLGVFLTLSVFMSCLTKRSSSSFLFLLVIWVFSVLIIPRASVLIAGNAVDVPSLNSILYQQNQLEDKYSMERSKRYYEFSSKLDREMYESGDTSPEAQERSLNESRNFSEKLDIEYNKKIESFVGRLYEERYNKQVEQQKLAFNISRLSPASLFTLVSSGICGTSIDLKNKFYENAASYSQSLAEFIKGKTGHNIGSAPISIFNQDGQMQKKPPEPIDTTEIPEFIFKAPELSEVLYDAMPDIAILLLFNLIFFCGSFLAFLRYDLR
jgi:ABC-type transport system involved in multi-copper enzyme maturation permease subunit